MKFALSTHVPRPEGADPAQIFAETIELAQYGEELGFHSIWLAEHHFSRYSLGSSSLVLASGIAASTKRIRVGTGVLIPSLHNPIKLAEDTATVDAVSGGRLDVGFGRGTFGYEYGGFKVDEAESQKRFQEGINIIKGLWTTSEFSYDGEFWQVDKLNLSPPPTQKPHPPVYIAATRTLETLEHLIDSGYGLCLAVVQDTAPALELCQRFLQLSADRGRQSSLSDVPFFGYLYVAETEEQACNEAEPHLKWVLDIMQWRKIFKESSEVPYSIDDWRRGRTQLPMSYDTMLQNRAFVGDPRQCVEKIRELQAKGVEYFGCNFDFGGIDHAKVMKSMELFSKEVMPHFV